MQKITYPGENATQAELEAYYSSLPPEQIDKHTAASEKAKAVAAEKERIAKGRQRALSNIAKISALKAILADLKSQENILGQVWLDIPGQAFPREGTIAKAFGLSETELSNAKAEGAKAVKGL